MLLKRRKRKEKEIAITVPAKYLYEVQPYKVKRKEQIKLESVDEMLINDRLLEHCDFTVIAEVKPIGKETSAFILKELKDLGPISTKFFDLI